MEANAGNINLHLKRFARISLHFMLDSVQPWEFENGLLTDTWCSNRRNSNPQGWRQAKRTRQLISSWLLLRFHGFIFECFYYTRNGARGDGRLLFDKNGSHTAFRLLLSFVLAISMRSQDRIAVKHNPCFYQLQMIYLHLNFVWRLPRKLLDWFTSTWSSVTRATIHWNY